MNKKTQKTILITFWFITLVIFGHLSISINPVSAETIVTNSVSVSADSNSTSESRASVTTVVNGEVIEDWSVTSTEPIEYSHSYSSASTTVTTPSSDETRGRLEAMIAHLEAIILLYVTLLNS